MLGPDCKRSPDPLGHADPASDVDDAGHADLDPRLLAERLLDRVRATVHYLVAADPDADDLVQLAMVEILRSVAGFRGESRLETWADRITIRTTMRGLGKRRRRQARLTCESVDELAPVEEQERELSRRLLRRRLARALGRLSPERRVAVVLRHVHGYSVQEIAELTDAPINTVRDRLRKGVKRLRGLTRTDPLLRDWAGETS
jgi:RNA polymerase sigma-70 factor (ECF subfamily)